LQDLKTFFIIFSLSGHGKFDSGFSAPRSLKIYSR
jgi:hypothetical protein